MYRWLLLGLVGCGRVAFDPTGGGGDGGRVVDAAPCTEPWSAPFVVLPPDVREPTIRGDGLEMYTTNGADVFVSTRASRSDAFSTPVVLAMPPNSTYSEYEPSISDDGLELFIGATVNSNGFTYHVVRERETDTFGTPTQVGILGGVDISRDRLSLYSSDYMFPIRVHRRLSTTEPFTTIGNLSDVVNAPGTQNSAPSISSDDLDLYFSRTTGGPAELWVAHRASPTDEFSTAERIDIPNFASNPDISADGHFLYYGGGDYGIWAISRCE